MTEGKGKENVMMQLLTKKRLKKKDMANIYKYYILACMEIYILDDVYKAKHLRKTPCELLQLNLNWLMLRLILNKHKWRARY